MAPRNGLNAAGKRARLEAEATLRAIGEDPGLSVGAIDRYASAMGQLADLERLWKQAGRPATTDGGSTGATTVPHPLVGQINAARKQAAELGDALGLDPQARRKLSRRVTGGQPGATSAADRSAPSRRSLRAA